VGGWPSVCGVARPVLAVEAELSRHAFSLTDTFLPDDLSLWRRLIVVHVIDDFEPESVFVEPPQVISDGCGIGPIAPPRDPARPAPAVHELPSCSGPI
jgi:hypothetical protein